MNKEITPDDIQRFLNNQMEAEEAEYVEKYLKEIPDAELSLYLSDDAFFDVVPNPLPGNIRSAMRKAIKREVTGDSYRWVRQMMIAASVVGFLWVGYYFLTSSQASGIQSIGYTASTLTKEQIKNRSAEQKYVHLPDGTGVLLNAGASIIYFNNYLENRFVYMEGKARFDVKHNPSRPFTVIANGIGTLDIGTSFWVENNRKDATITVQLLSGEIAVKSLENSFPDRNVNLQPGEQITIRKTEGKFFISNREVVTAVTKKTPLPSDPIDHTTMTWTNAAYTFSKSPLEKVFHKLSARYHVIIKIEDPSLIEGREFTGKIMYSDSLNVLLDAVCTMNQLTYKTQGDHILISKN